MDHLTPTIRDLADSAIRLDSDVYGNPRYYIPAYLFWDVLGKGARPLGAMKYRGKKYGPGWVFQSYALENDLREAIKQTREA